MINKKFHWLLREPRDVRGRPVWTIGRVAEAIYCNRATVNDALNNVAPRGRQTRPKLVKFFRKEFPDTWPQILDALSWDARGEIKQPVPCGKSQVEQSEECSTC
jgi:hypothetical protein